MMKKLMHNSLVAAGFAALLLVGACASTNDTAADGTNGGDDMVEVTQSNTVAPAPGPAKVDSSGNIYSSSAAPGSGNAASVGTNTNVNVVPERSSIDLSASTTVESTTLQSEEAILDEAEARGTLSGTSATTDNTATFSTTTTTRTESVPMTSSSTTDMQSTTDMDTDTTTTTATTTRTRMRKD